MSTDNQESLFDADKINAQIITVEKLVIKSYNQAINDAILQVRNAYATEPINLGGSPIQSPLHGGRSKGSLVNHIVSRLEKLKKSS